MKPYKIKDLLKLDWKFVVGTLIVTLVIIPIAFNFLFMGWQSKYDKGETSDWFSFYGNIFGGLIGGFFTFVSLLLTFRREEENKLKEKRAFIKLKLKSLSSYLYVFRMESSALGMEISKMINETLIYNYSRDFLEFHNYVFKELSEADERLFDIFDRKFEEEYKICQHILRYEKANSTKFMAGLLNIYNIFKDDLTKDLLNEPNNGFKQEERFEYTALELFYILEVHIQSKLTEFDGDVKEVINGLKK